MQHSMAMNKEFLVSLKLMRGIATAQKVWLFVLLVVT